MARHKRKLLSLLTMSLVFLLAVGAFAQPLPGGTLDPTTVQKFVTPLVIPPVMKNTGTANDYDIAVRQFQQQILPSGMPATTIWSYGPAADPVPTLAPAANSQFNYPAYTIETTSDMPVSVKWRNELVAIDPATGFPCDGNACQRTFLPHLLPIDQTLHWANPPATGCLMGTPNRTDCATANATFYTGPVPIITHVHGAHVEPHSDGYPEAWWLPNASNIPAGYVTEGSLFDDALGQLPGLNQGFADFAYRNDQPATTLWYHDHTLGMTRSNVYAGPAGFWLVRGGLNDLVTGLPGPAPVAGQGVGPLNTPGNAVRNSIREIPIAVQDRSFNADGSLFYPDSRSFFDAYPGPYIPTTDVSPFWNPEAFFNTMVVNGATWPTFEVAPALYRLRFLNGCNSRFLWLKFSDPAVNVWQIGAEQGFLPAPVLMNSLNLDQTADGTAQLLIGLAERADTIVDFRGLANGTMITLLNIGPDAPFGGGIPGTDFPPADPGTSGQVMQFVVNSALLGASPTDPVLADGTTPNPNAATDPSLLVLPAQTALGVPSVTRNVSLNEANSGQACVIYDLVTGAVSSVAGVLPSVLPTAEAIAACAAIDPLAVPLDAIQAKLGIVDLTTPALPLGIALNWDDMTVSTPLMVMRQNGLMSMVSVTENPQIVNGVAPIEEWNIYNFTVDAHPIHLHLVGFQVVNRMAIPGVVPAPVPVPQQPWETGFKDTVIAYPGEITTVRALFDIGGLYVWHCHIVEHEDNEMMRPYIVSATYTLSGTVTSGGAGLVGVTMTLSGASSATTTTAADGTYTFTGLVDGSYTVTPGLTGYTFAPTSS
ncbi:MAG: multicopper oxidase domain-containing protein, partial [Thermodesulfovibrionales bacterium]